MPGTTDDDARPFADWLRELSKGRVHQDATNRLAELVEAIHDTGKPGEITIRVKIKPQPKMDGRAVLAEGAVTAKIPAPDAATSLFFVDGPRLVRNAPEQPEIPDITTARESRNAR